MESLLKIDNLCVCYNGVSILKDFTIRVESGEILGIVGESGSGKSTLVRAVTGLIGADGRIEDGKITFDGLDLLQATPEQMRRLRGSQLGVVFQNPATSLNPTRKIENQFIETIRSHYQISRDKAYASILDMLAKLNLKDGHRVLQSYPFELSGGMNQRVAIALAMILQPKLLLADEPTSALDVTVQAQVVGEMMRLRENFGTSIIIITHNMGVVARMADRIGVMYAGKMVEYGSKFDILRRPVHPYTKALIQSIPSLNGKLPQGIKGSAPSFGDLHKGCSFAQRCSVCIDECFSQGQPLIEIEKDHWTACMKTGRKIRSVRV